LLKTEEKETDIERNKDENQKTRNELKVLDLETYPLKNEERTKNGGKPPRICLRKPLGSVTEAPRLGFSSRKQFFSPKTAEMHSQGNQRPLEQPPFAFL